MSLSVEQREQLVEILTNNEDTRAGKAWKDVDLEEATDDQLLAFNELHSLLEPVENGISCPCGVTHSYNEEDSQWEYEGVPTNNQRKVKVPNTLNEFFNAGGGTAKDKEVYRMMTTNYDKMHLEAFDQLTTNASDELRQELWEGQGYKNKSLAELQTMLQLLPKQRELTSNSQYDRSGQYNGDVHRNMVGNMFGAQGAPAMGEMTPSDGQRVLEIDTLDYKELAKERRTG